jgi:hypothetical protein
MVFQFRIGGEIAASDLCLMRDGTLYVLKTTYNEHIDKVSPALLMRTSIMQWLFENGTCRSIEFYGRVMEWHRRFASDVRELFQLDYYRTPTVRQVADIAVRVRRWGEQYRQPEEQTDARPSDQPPA